MNDEQKQEVVGGNPDAFVAAAKMILEQQTKIRPRGWSKKSRSPYYTEECAYNMKEIFDSMIQDGKRRVMYFKDYPKVREETLLQKVNQGKLYLLQRLDPDGKYAQFCAKLFIRHRRGIGLIFDLSRPIAKLITSPLMENDEIEIVELREDINNFLSEGKIGEKLERIGLSLSPENLEEIENMLEGVPNILSKVTLNSIKIIKHLFDEKE